VDTNVEVRDYAMSAEIINLRIASNVAPNVSCAGRIGSHAVSFGPFCLWPAERRLEKAGIPVQLGGRSLDILMLLVERAGEVVSKTELIKRVWADVTVEEFNLRVNIASLRKALGDGQEGASYVSNVPGRGYCFVAPILPVPDELSARGVDVVPTAKLPPRPTSMVGRDDVVHEISDRLATRRFVTIVGSGGIGKSTVAAAIAHRLAPEFDDAACFVDFAAIAEPDTAFRVLASTLGLTFSAENSVSSLVAHLSSKRMLLLLDNCEHLIETISVLSEAIFAGAPHVHILATSRETLRVEGESVYRLFPLSVPQEAGNLTAAEALNFPAIRLFVECVAAKANGYKLSDADAPIVAEICRKLDGIALAIELAANRVDAYGIEGTAALLGDCLRLLRSGRRTALPRHQTLRASLDWGCALLTDHERTVLGRLSIFVGAFTLDAALVIAAADDLRADQIVDAFASLVAKSLILPDTTRNVTCYRLLNTQRAYCREKLLETGSLDVIARRHAQYYYNLLSRCAVVDSDSIKIEKFSGCQEHLPNVAAALEWAFSDHRDIVMGGKLAAVASLLFSEPLLDERTHGAILEDGCTMPTRATGFQTGSGGLRLVSAAWPY
jgi:predicted ATPase/DNA-binding winged helix-turn-helix (wHTH) protein